MASCFFLLKQFEDVLVYLKSIKSYLATDDDFNWNYGIACASNGEWAEAEEALLAVQNEGYRQEGPFLTWSARTFIMQGKLVWRSVLLAFAHRLLLHLLLVCWHAARGAAVMCKVMLV